MLASSVCDPGVIRDFIHIEIEQVSEDLCGAATELGEGIATRFLVHVFPAVLFEHGDSLTHLSNQTECIGLQVAQNVFHVTIAVYMAESSHIPECLSEQTVLVVEEEQVNLIVCSLHRVFVGNVPDVGSGVSEEAIDFSEFFWNPLSETFVTWSFVKFAHTVETLVASVPDTLGIEVEEFKLSVEVK